MEILTSSELFEYVKFGILFGFALAAFIGILGLGINTLLGVFNILTSD